MRIDGRWLRGSDGVERPVIDAHLLLPNGQLAALPFLLDTGADFTVLSFTAAQQLAGYVAPTPGTMEAIGLGSSVATQSFAVDLILRDVNGQQARLSGPIPALTSLDPLDLPVLGRNALDLFDVVYSRPRGLLTLLTRPDTLTLA